MQRHGNITRHWFGWIALIAFATIVFFLPSSAFAKGEIPKRGPEENKKEEKAFRSIPVPPGPAPVFSSFEIKKRQLEDFVEVFKRSHEALGKERTHDLKQIIQEARSEEEMRAVAREVSDYREKENRPSRELFFAERLHGLDEAILKLKTRKVQLRGILQQTISSESSVGAESKLEAAAQAIVAAEAALAQLRTYHTGRTDADSLVSAQASLTAVTRAIAEGYLQLQGVAIEMRNLPTVLPRSSLK